MGAFFTNIHVRLEPADAERQLATLIERLAAAAYEDGYRPAADGEQPDRIIVVTETANPAWAVVYDEDSDAQDLRALERLARAISTDGVALSALVNDSDDLVLSLFRNGRRADRLHFNSAAHEQPSPRKAAWRDLLGERNFATATPFAEAPLQAIASTLNWDERYAFLGFTHRDELPPGPRTELALVLRPEFRFIERRTGPPHLRQFARTISVRVVLAHAANGFGWSATFHNEGGPFRGISVLLRLTKELEELVEVRDLAIFADGTGREMKTAGEVVETDGVRFLRARFPDVSLQAWPDAQRELTAAETFKLDRALETATTRAVVYVRPRRAGTCRAELYALPLENGREGAAVASFSIEIHEKPWWGEA